MAVGQTPRTPLVKHPSHVPAHLFYLTLRQLCLIHMIHSVHMKITQSCQSDAEVQKPSSMGEEDSFIMYIILNNILKD